MRRVVKKILEVSAEEMNGAWIDYALRDVAPGFFFLNSRGVNRWNREMWSLTKHPASVAFLSTLPYPMMNGIPVLIDDDLEDDEVALLVPEEFFGARGIEMSEWQRGKPKHEGLYWLCRRGIVDGAHWYVPRKDLGTSGWWAPWWSDLAEDYYDDDLWIGPLTPPESPKEG